MRLFRVTEDEKYEEITTSARLHNLDDAIITAKEAGDGDYVTDWNNGTATVFKVEAGALNFDPKNGRIKVTKEESPSYVYDQENPDLDPRFDSLAVQDEWGEPEPRATEPTFEEHADVT